MTIDEEIRILKELQSSAGWNILRRYMESAVLRAAMDMANGQPMPPEQYQFWRGAMWAAKRHISLPEELTRQLELEVLLSKDPAATAANNSSTVPLRPDITKETF